LNAGHMGDSGYMIIRKYNGKHKLVFESISM